MVGGESGSPMLKDALAASMPDRRAAGQGTHAVLFCEVLAAEAGQGAPCSIQPRVRNAGLKVPSLNRR